MIFIQCFIFYIKFKNRFQVQNFRLYFYNHSVIIHKRRHTKEVEGVMHFGTPGHKAQGIRDVVTLQLNLGSFEGSLRSFNFKLLLFKGASKLRNEMSLEDIPQLRVASIKLGQGCQIKPTLNDACSTSLLWICI